LPTLAAVRPHLAEVAALLPALTALTAIVGFIGVFTSVMIYVDTRRPFWAASLTAPKFFGTTLTLGSVAAAFAFAWTGAGQPALVAIAAATALRAGLFLWEQIVQRHPGAHRAPAVARATRTVQRFLPWAPQTSMALFAGSLLAGVVAMIAHGTPSTVAIGLALGATFAASLLERFCFFSTCPAPRMPGGVSA